MLSVASGADNEIRSKIPTHYFICIYICTHTYIFTFIYCHSQYLYLGQKYVF